MSDSNPAAAGDSELAAPMSHDSAVALGATAAETRPSAVRDVPEAAADSDDDDDLVRTTDRPRPSHTVLLLAAILVMTFATAVIGWFALSATSQLRDQYAIANGLQRCLITAQLNENSANDPTGAAYKAAVQVCLKR